jgi:hypothetical protein
MLWAKATQDGESAAVMDVLGDLPQSMAERLGKRKCFGRNGCRGQIKACFCQRSSTYVEAEILVAYSGSVAKQKGFGSVLLVTR